jgi:hypothetical protein
MERDEVRDRTLIRETVENWVVWRDGGFWDELLTAWHSDGVMTSTWMQAPAADFVAASRAGWERGVDVLHSLGGSAVEVVGTRAIAQTKMRIAQRAPVHDVLVDVTCQGRFYDFFEWRDERWAIVLRQIIYERDRMDPVDPAATLTLDATLLGSFPDGYRHLGYLQTQAGMTVKRDLAGRRGAAVEELYALGRAWLV